MSAADRVVTDEAVLYETTDTGVAILTFNRPDRLNAWGPDIAAGFYAAIDRAEQDPAVRAIVLTAAGDRTFCSGMDLREFASGGGASGSSEGMAGFERLLRGELTVPVVGAANGTAVGGGLELLLGCDGIVAAETARFGLPEVKRGLYPAGGGTAIGTRIPLAVALEMTMTGEPIEAVRAYEVGLINAVVPPEQVLGVTDPAQAAQRNKELQRSVFSSEDAREGAAAFMEKRKPVWKGR